MIQIFGTKKCKDTQKAIRYLKERRIEFQFIDLNIKGMSPGELNKVSQKVPLEEMIDKSSKEFEKKNLKYIKHDVRTVLLEYPLLLRTPVIRNANQAFIGFDPDLLDQMIQN